MGNDKDQTSHKVVNMILTKFWITKLIWQEAIAFHYKMQQEISSIQEIENMTEANCHEIPSAMHTNCKNLIES